MAAADRIEASPPPSHQRLVAAKIAAWPREVVQTLWQAATVAKVVSVEKWLRQQCAEYDCGLGGLFRSQGEHEWPVIAQDEDDLEAQLNAGGHISSCRRNPPRSRTSWRSESSSFLVDRVEQLDGATATRGTERGYPDLELGGPLFGGGFHAVDVKIARRAVNAAGQPVDRTQSRITLYTGNTYFRHPKVAFPGVMRPFADYATHLDVLGIYTLNESKPGRVDDLELIVQQPWKIASTKRSSTTREYIGAVDKVDDLRAGKGEFSTEKEFYAYWRRFPFKTARAVELLLARQLEK